MSTELDMSLSYGKPGQVWEWSEVGSKLSCVVLSEVIDHKDVKLHTDGKKDLASKGTSTNLSMHVDPKRNQLEDSESGKVPEKYLIVRNNDLIRNRYLLVSTYHDIFIVTVTHDLFS